MPEDQQHFCNWCGRPQNEVGALVPAQKTPRVFICDGCIERCSAALVDFQKKKVDDTPLPKPREIIAHLDEYVIGQTMAKEYTAIAVYNHYKRKRRVEAGLASDDVEIQKSNILMLGPSGCGKTQIARTTARFLKVPFFVQDATSLTEAGYVGEDVDNMIQGLLEQCDWNVELAQWGVIVIDETDKLGRKSGREVAGYKDVSGEGVQQALLKMIEGGERMIAKGVGTRLLDPNQQAVVKIDTSNILFICMGSFDGIQDVIERRVNKEARLGFGGHLKRDVPKEEVYAQVEEDDILDFGIIPELAGRLPVITSVLPLTEDELVKVLTEPKDALVKQYKALFDYDGVDLQFEDKALYAIAREAAKRETGARALRRILERVLLPHSLSVPDDPTIQVLRITEDAVLGKGDPVIVRKGGGGLAEA